MSKYRCTLNTCVHVSVDKSIYNMLIFINKILDLILMHKASVIQLEAGLVTITKLHLLPHYVLIQHMLWQWLQANFLKVCCLVWSWSADQSASAYFLLRQQTVPQYPSSSPLQKQNPQSLSSLPEPPFPSLLCSDAVMWLNFRDLGGEGKCCVVLPGHAHKGPAWPPFPLSQKTNRHGSGELSSTCTGTE